MNAPLIGASLAFVLANLWFWWSQKRWHTSTVIMLFTTWPLAGAALGYLVGVML